MLTLEQAIERFSGSCMFITNQKETCEQIADYLKELQERRKADGCEGCKNIGLWENEYEYGVSCPCLRCARRAQDNYEPERRTETRNLQPVQRGVAGRFISLLDVTGEPAVLELLAEECTELAHAALKLARKYRGENPTPRTRSECLRTLEGELADVLTVVDQLGGIVDMAAVAEHKEEKLERWRARVNLTSQ